MPSTFSSLNNTQHVERIGAASLVMMRYITRPWRWHWLAPIMPLNCSSKGGFKSHKLYVKWQLTELCTSICVCVCWNRETSTL